MSDLQGSYPVFEGAYNPSRFEFRTVVLPKLALHYRREALKALEGKHPWLKPFRSAHADCRRARKQFFEDGSDCITTLKNHYELVSLMAINDDLTRQYGVLYIMFMVELTKSIDFTVSQRAIAQSPNVPEKANLVATADTRRSKVVKIIDFRTKNKNLNGETTLDRLATSFLEAAEESAAERSSQNTDSRAQNDNSTERALEKAREIVDGPHRETVDQQLNAMEGKYGRLHEFTLRKTYNSNLKGFTYNVGCPEAHEGFKQNIAELRKFHATQMPFFQKLQDDLQAQIKLNKEQQEIITALVFRHLIENLPPNPYRGKTSATDRWLAFWEDAVRNEYENPTYHRYDTSKNPHETDHPLRGLINDKVFTKLIKGPPATGIYPAKRGVGTGQQNFDRDPQGKLDEAGEKAQMYRWGKELFGLLSKNIHAYEAKGMEGYQVEDDHWGKGFRDILKRLKPVEYDVVGDESVVNWEEERKRYIDQANLRPVDP